jgi:hypothetical protein
VSCCVVFLLCVEVVECCGGLVLWCVLWVCLDLCWFVLVFVVCCVVVRGVGVGWGGLGWVGCQAIKKIKKKRKGKSLLYSFSQG